LKLGQEGILGC